MGRGKRPRDKEDDNDDDIILKKKEKWWETLNLGTQQLDWID